MQHCSDTGSDISPSMQATYDILPDQTGHLTPYTRRGIVLGDPELCRTTKEIFIGWPADIWSEFGIRGG